MQKKITMKKNISMKAIHTGSAILAAILLPQLFHAVGVLSGIGSAAGAAFLPMHIPVLLAGFLGGPLVGILAGALSPLISFWISGMPALPMLPFMMIELGIYGLTAGMLTKTKLPLFVQLLLTQIAGRAARIAAGLISIYLFDNPTLTVASACWTFITAGAFGILLQWALIPLFTKYLKGIQERYV